jgi:hypothetical protein
MDLVQDMVRNPPADRAPNWLGWSTEVWTVASAEIWLRHEADPGFADRFREEGLPAATFSVHSRSPERNEARIAAGS